MAGRKAVDWVLKKARLGSDLLNGVSVFTESVKRIAEQFGYIVDEVTVTVWGTPYCSKQALYYLAASTAFGIGKRMNAPAGTFLPELPPPGAIAIEYDAADNYLTFTVKFVNTMAFIAAMNPSDGDGFLKEPSLVVLKGPPDDVVGGAWNFWGAGFGKPIAIPGIVDEVLPGFRVPNLRRWEGKTILTNAATSVPPVAGPVGAVPAAPTINPRPSADLRSRGSLANLVYSALTTPGTSLDMTFTKPVGGPDGLDGYRGA